jgi:N-acylneuraminate cytidylyltransferase
MAEGSSVLAIIPVRGMDLVKTGGMPSLGRRPLMAYTVEMAKRSRSIHRIVVSTDSEEVRKLAVELGAEAPFLRPAELSSSGTPIERVLQHCLLWLEEREGFSPKIVVRLEISHPFREEGLIDRVIQALLEQNLDTVFTAFEEHHNFWKVNRFGELEPIIEEHRPRSGRPPVYKEISGVVSASRAAVVRAGQRLGARVGVVPLSSLQALVDTQDELGMDLAKRLL